MSEPVAAPTAGLTGDRSHSPTDGAVGVMAPRDLDPARLPDFCRQAERLGFDEVWVVDDLGFSGGLTQAAIALSVTERVRVGVGVLPAAVRNVVYTAMEATTLARAFPGRLVLGVGHGMSEWMRQVGVDTVGSVDLLEQHLSVLRALLAGEEVTTDGPHVRVRAIRLEQPPTVVPEVLAGVRGPRSLAASGRAADGTILAEPVTPEYVDAARQAMGATAPHRLVAYNLAAVDPDPSVARDLVRPGLGVVGEPGWAPHVKVLPFYDELAALRASSPDAQTFAASMPDAWVDRLALVGDVATVQRRVSDLHLAGVHTVVMTPTAADPLAQLDSLAQVVATSGGVR